MSQMLGLHLWPRNTTTCGGNATSANPTTTCSSSLNHHHRHDDPPSINCCGVARLVRKLKRRSKMLRTTAAAASRQSSFQCRYDPLSYSLNFDNTSGGSGNLLDEDFNRVYAFSSRFAATPRTDCQTILMAASH